MTAIMCMSKFQINKFVLMVLHIVNGMKHTSLNNVIKIAYTIFWKIYNW